MNGVRALDFLCSLAAARRLRPATVPSGCPSGASDGAGVVERARIALVDRRPLRLDINEPVQHNQQYTEQCNECRTDKSKLFQELGAMEAHEPGQADEPGQAIADIATVASVPELAAKSKLLRKELLSQRASVAILPTWPGDTELVHIVGVAYLASSATSLFHGKRCVVEGTLLGAYVQQVLAGFPVPKCDKTLREFRNRCILLFYAWDQEELTRRLLSFVTTQKHRDVFSLFVSACLRVSALQQALVQAAGAETLACLEYLTEHTQGGKPWTVASVGAYLADRSTSTGWPLLLAREPVLVDECGLCIAPNPATGGLDLQTLAMLVQGDMIILGSRTFRHKLRLDEQWRQHAQAQEQGDLHAQGDLSAFLQGVQVGGWNACDPLVPALYNARTTVMSLLGYEPQPVLIIARTVHPQEFIYVNYGSAFWEEQGPL
eukprot:g25488.t1